MDETSLLKGIVEGSQEAFDHLYRRYSTSVRRFLAHYLQDSSAADDLVQETFLNFWRRPYGFDPERGALKQYLFGIARKRAAQWKREARPTVSEDGEEPVVDNTADHTIVRMALEQLDKDQRALLWLREVEGYSYVELAGILGIPVGTVKSRLFFAREALRQVWLSRRKS